MYLYSGIYTHISVCFVQKRNRYLGGRKGEMVSGRCQNHIVSQHLWNVPYISCFVGEKQLLYVHFKLLYDKETPKSLLPYGLSCPRPKMANLKQSYSKYVNDELLYSPCALCAVNFFAIISWFQCDQIFRPPGI